VLISVFAQICIILLACPAIWLVVKYDGWRETIGVGLGVLAIPFIAYSALRHGQWGFIIPCIVFIVATFPVLLTGFKNKFKKTEP
jgi:hypothetical protein